MNKYTEQDYYNTEGDVTTPEIDMFLELAIGAFTFLGIFLLSVVFCGIV